MFNQLPGQAETMELLAINPEEQEQTLYVSCLITPFLFVWTNFTIRIFPQEDRRRMIAEAAQKRMDDSDRRGITKPQSQVSCGPALFMPFYNDKTRLCQ